MAQDPKPEEEQPIINGGDTQKTEMPNSGEKSATPVPLPGQPKAPEAPIAQIIGDTPGRDTSTVVRGAKEAGDKGASVGVAAGKAGGVGYDIDTQPTDKPKALEAGPTPSPKVSGGAFNRSYQGAQDASAKQDPDPTHPKFSDKTKERKAAAIDDSESPNAKLDLDQLTVEIKSLKVETKGLRKEDLSLREDNQKQYAQLVKQLRETEDRVSTVQSAQYKPSLVRKAIGTLAVASLGILYFDAVYTKQRALDELKAADSALEAKIAAIGTTRQEQPAITEAVTEYVDLKLAEASATAAADNANTKAYAEKTTQEVKAALQQVRDVLGENTTEIARNHAAAEANKTAIEQVDAYAHGTATATAQGIAEMNKRFSEYLQSQQAARTAPATKPFSESDKTIKKAPEYEGTHIPGKADSTKTTAQETYRTEEAGRTATDKTKAPEHQRFGLDYILSNRISRFDEVREAQIKDAQNYSAEMFGADARILYTSLIDTAQSHLENGTWGTPEARKELREAYNGLQEAAPSLMKNVDAQLEGMRRLFIAPGGKKIPYKPQGRTRRIS